MPSRKTGPEAASDADDLRRAVLRCAQPGVARAHPGAPARTSLGARISLGGRLVVEPQKRPGFNDGLILPGSEYPLGTSLRAVRRAAADRAPLRGLVRVIVVLVDFSDAPMGDDAGSLSGSLLLDRRDPTGSVREYFTEVSHGLLTLTGEVVGPYRLPRTLAAYAGGQSGTDNPEPNARTMARDAAVRANVDVNFAPYDNDGNGFVDAFIVVHAGPGAEETGSTGHIWSHKWVLTERSVQRRRHEDLRLSHDSGGQQDWRVCPRTGTSRCSDGPISTTPTVRVKAWATGA